MTEAVAAPETVVVAPAPAPAPAPVAAPAPAPAPVAAPEGATAITYDVTGDPALDLFTSFVGGLGIASEDPVMVAAADGDFSLLKAKLASLGPEAKGWEHYLALAEKSYTDSEAQAQATVAATKTVLHEVSGGEEAWKAIQTWAGANASPEEKDAINEALLAGGIRARMAVMMLKSQYEAKGNYAPADPARPDASRAAPTPAASTPLNRREAVQQINDLVRRFGSEGIQQRAEYQAIMARVPKR